MAEELGVVGSNLSWILQANFDPGLPLNIQRKTAWEIKKCALSVKIKYVKIFAFNFCKSL